MAGGRSHMAEQVASHGRIAITARLQASGPSLWASSAALCGMALGAIAVAFAPAPVDSEPNLAKRGSTPVGITPSSARIRSMSEDFDRALAETRQVWPGFIHVSTECAPIWAAKFGESSSDFGQT